MGRFRLAVLASLFAILSFGSSAAIEMVGKGKIAIEVDDTNAAITGLVIRCRGDFVIGVVTPGRRLRPKRDYGEEETLFETLFDRAAAVVDGARFPLGVGGANDEATVYLFGEDQRGLLEALHGGAHLQLEFDILPKDAKDGEGFETTAEFTIAELGPVLETAGRACRL
ncbi:MAG: hypothetical protein AAGB11_07455 [Pseudomonadota bacterium]